MIKGSNITIAAYYYSGWHPCPIRDKEYPAGWSEWDLVYNCRPRFPGHVQPLLPVWGKYNEADPETFKIKVKAAVEYNIDVFIFGFFWSRGKRLLEGALNHGYLPISKDYPLKFALMWANRMPRKVLPIKNPRDPLISDDRLVYTDENDFVEFVLHVAQNYFIRESYFRIDGKAYLSIFDTNFFLRQMTPQNAYQAIIKARTTLRRYGLGELHLAAIDPIPKFQPLLKEIGFDSVTHYVFLPEWKGEFLQDFKATAARRIQQWPTFSVNSNLPYFPSVSPGWDASARGCEFGKEKPKRYPWWPIIINKSPDAFAWFLSEACLFSIKQNPNFPMVLIASWNEWSEGHYIEPDIQYGEDWLKAVKRTKSKLCFF